MNILVIDNEIYLAQKVVSRLLEEGYNCDHSLSIDKVDENKYYDTVLLSTNLSNDICQETLRRYKDSNIILLASYVSDVTVTEPMNQGAKDYIVKPFVMDHLINKIERLYQNRMNEKKLEFYEKYFNAVLEDISLDINFSKLKYPLLVEASNKDVFNKILFNLDDIFNKKVKFINLKICEIEKIDLKDEYFYVMLNYHFLKNSSKEILNNILRDKNNVIIHSIEQEDIFAYEKLTFDSNINFTKINQIMTINDYVKLMILNFQSQYPDTELSKKLGISRKSLWEKRKKFGIEKSK